MTLKAWAVSNCQIVILFADTLMVVHLRNLTTLARYSTHNSLTAEVSDFTCTDVNILQG